jgi:hypothetical protein
MIFRFRGNNMAKIGKKAEKVAKDATAPKN